jgi:hypothetical protein
VKDFSNSYSKRKFFCLSCASVDIGKPSYLIIHWILGIYLMGGVAMIGLLGGQMDHKTYWAHCQVNKRKVKDQ